LANLKDAAAATGELVRQSPLADMDVAALAATAATSAGVVNADAELSKWRMARAAMTPRSTASRVVKALGAEVIRQTLDKDDQAPALGAPDDPEGDPHPP
jgi:predicted metal-binding membrane protein